MIILDTNVVSELLRPAPDPNVERWLAAQDGSEVFMTSIGEAELRYGVSLLPPGQRRTRLFNAIDNVHKQDFDGRILSFDRHAAIEYAHIAAKRRAAGRPISQFDCQIAAIAKAHGAILATRNQSDFQGCGIEVVDPWHRIEAREPDSPAHPAKAGSRPGPRVRPRPVSAASCRSP